MDEQSQQLEKERFRALLESQHSFPGSYTFKVIYRNEEGMALVIRNAINEATGIEVGEDMVAVRASSGANFMSMTLDLDVQRAQDVLDIYDVLSKVKNIVSWF